MKNNLELCIYTDAETKIQKKFFMFYLEYIKKIFPKIQVINSQNINYYSGILFYVPFTHERYKIIKKLKNFNIVYVELRNHDIDFFSDDLLVRKKFLESCCAVIYHDIRSKYRINIKNEYYIPIKYKKINTKKNISLPAKYFNSNIYVDYFLNMGFRVKLLTDFNISFYLENNYSVDLKFNTIQDHLSLPIDITMLWINLLKKIKSEPILYDKNNDAEIFDLLSVSKYNNSNSFVCPYFSQGKTLQSLSTNLEIFKNQHFKNSPIQDFINIFFDGYFIVDRFNQLNRFSNYNIYNFSDSIPNIDECLKFDDVIDQTTNKILSYNKNIYIMWSGGIDSSCVLYSFLKNTNQTINILHTKNSIIENNFLYNFLKNNKQCKLTQYDEKDFKSVYTKILDNPLNYIVSGQHGDDLFILPKKDGFQSLYNKCYIDVFNTISEMYNIPKKSFIDIFKEYFNSFNINIKLFHEALWFMKYALRWKYIDNEFNLAIGNYYQNYCGFFGDILFQQWAISNFHKSPSRDIMKLYILKYLNKHTYILDIDKRSSAFYPRMRNILSIYDEEKISFEIIPNIIFNNQIIFNSFLENRLKKYLKK